jgi:hypothetical protein
LGLDPVDEQVLKSKFLGALIGTGVGDSLGSFLKEFVRLSPKKLWLEFK